MSEICSKLTIKRPEKRQRHLAGVFIDYFEQISHSSGASITNSEQTNVGNVGWKCLKMISGGNLFVP